MKRALCFCLILALTLVLTACTGAPVGVASSQPAPSAPSASEGTSEIALSREEAASAPAVEPDGLYDVDAAVQAAGLSRKDDVSACFPADAEGYLVNRGPYLVDAATIVRLTTAKVEGTGSVQWIGYQKKSALSGERAIDGVI
ncbi:MAG: hypothetical protein J6X61_02310, partial [Clostridia bacterium]|nr:hypothetical protein [Clostridia bacterium]